MSEERKVGENFDAGEADSIFDKLRNVEGKIKPKRDGKFDNITYMMQEAQLLLINHYLTFDRLFC